MAKKLADLIGKVEQLLVLFEDVKKENSDLKKENRDLKKELFSIKKECDLLKIAAVDNKDKVSTKLTGILNRLEQLEELAS